MRHHDDASDEQLQRWQAELPAPYRTPEREVPAGLLCGGSLLQDLADGKPNIGPQTLARLRGTEAYKRPSLHDPSIDRLGQPADAVLSAGERKEREQERLEQLPVVVRRWLTLLPQKQATVLRLRYGIGCRETEVRDIAGALGCTRKSVWENEQRALKTLRALLLTHPDVRITDNLASGVASQWEAA